VARDTAVTQNGFRCKYLKKKRHLEDVNVDGRAIKWIGEARANGALCDKTNELLEIIKECMELWMFIAMV
jgi:hypothetical protein